MDGEDKHWSVGQAKTTDEQPKRETVKRDGQRSLF